MTLSDETIPCLLHLQIGIPTSEQMNLRPVDNIELGSLSDTRTAIVMDASWRSICLQAPT